MSALRSRRVLVRLCWSSFSVSRDDAGASPPLRATRFHLSSSTLSIICICIPVETGCIAINDTMACSLYL